MKSANECKDINEIRTEIDRIDKEIIALVAKRASYVKAAARFKKDRAMVEDPNRVKTMLQQRAEWARESGMNTEIIVKIYTELVNFFINEEMIEWQKE